MSNPADDAAFIAEQHMRAAQSVSEFTELRESAISSIQSGIADLGGEIIDRDQFSEQLFGDFKEKFFKDICEVTKDALQATLTPKELKDLAAYYRTVQGQAFLSTSFNTYSNVQHLKGGPAEPLLEHLPELLASVDPTIRDAQARLGEMFSFTRLAEILERRDLVRFESEELRIDIVTALRSSGRS